MSTFRDYRQVIRSGTQSRALRRRPVPECDPAQLRELFRRIVEGSWSAGEIDGLRKISAIL